MGQRISRRRGRCAGSSAIRDEKMKRTFRTPWCLFFRQETHPLALRGHEGMLWLLVARCLRVGNGPLRSVPLVPLVPSFPRSAWERKSGRSASRAAVMLGLGDLIAASRHSQRLQDGTQSVPTCVPTRSVGTRALSRHLKRRPGFHPDRSLQRAGCRSTLQRLRHYSSWCDNAILTGKEVA